MKMVLRTAFLVSSFTTTVFAQEQALIDQTRIYDYLAKETTGQSGVTVMLPTGRTQWPIWQAYFEGMLNDNLAPSIVSLGANRANYALAVGNCLKDQAELSWFGGSYPDRAKYMSEIVAFVRYYVSLLPASDIPLLSQYSVIGGVPQFDCSSLSPNSFAMSKSTLGNLAYVHKFAVGSYPALVKNTLQPLRCGAFGMLPLHKLASIYFLRSHLGMVLSNFDFWTAPYGLDVITETPESIFKCKTTPWLYSNQQESDDNGRKPNWNELGMNSYYGWGSTPVHTWIAQQHFYSTRWGTIMNWTPILGSAWAAADSAQSFYEGRSLNGASESRLFSASMFALNYAFAVSDVAGVANLGTAAVAQMKALRTLAKVAPDAAQATSLLEKAKGILRNATGTLGVNTEAFRGIFGTPLAHENFWKAFASGWRGYTDDMSKRFGAGMELFLHGGFTRDGIRIQGAQEIIANLMANGGDAVQAYQAAKQKIEKAVGFSTRRATNGATADSVILAASEDRYGVPAVVMGPERMTGYPITGMPTESLNDLWTFVNGPGHEVFTFQGGIQNFVRKGEVTINGQKFLVKQIVMDASNKGMVNYIASQAARDAMELEMQALFTEAVTSTTTVERVMEIGIRMEYLINAVVPYKGGNSAIAQGWKHAILRSRGIQLGEIRQGIGFDTKSWALSFEEYLAKHPSFYKRVPEVINGVSLVTPSVSIPTAAASAAAANNLSGILDLTSSVKLLGVSGGFRNFIGWVANQKEFHDWDTYEGADPVFLSSLVPELQNPLILSILAFQMDASGNPVNTSSPIAQGILTLPPAAYTPAFNPATYSDWHMPGIKIDVPVSYDNGDSSSSNDFGIWAVWPGTEKKRKIYPEGGSWGVCGHPFDPGPPFGQVETTFATWQLTISGASTATTFCNAYNGTFRLRYLGDSCGNYCCPIYVADHGFPLIMQFRPKNETVYPTSINNKHDTNAYDGLGTALVLHWNRASQSWVVPPPVPGFYRCNTPGLTAVLSRTFP